MKRRHCLVATLAGIMVLSMGATGCGDLKQNSDGVVYDESALKQSVADDLNTTPDQIECRDNGTIVDSYGETRNVSFCHALGDSKGFSTGCYDTQTGGEMTIAVRNARGDQGDC